MSDKPKSELGDETWDHRWGYRDTCFVINEDRSVTLEGGRYPLSGYRMPEFLPYIEEVLGVEIDLENKRPESDPKPVPAPKRHEEFCREVETAFSSEQYSYDDRVRLCHSHGQTTADEVNRVIYGEIERVADMVFFCQAEGDVKRIIELARRHDVCLVPYGGGTSVSAALKLPASETRMIVSVDMNRMNRVLWVDGENLRACAEAGIRGSELERVLGKQGFMCGHEPDSIELSTLGGWISTNASGMKKNRYGNIEEIVEQITLVTPAGVVEHLKPLPRTSMGMQPQNLLFGSEGNLGLITKAVVRIHRKPECQKYGSLVFPDFEKGVRFLHELAHTGFVPASIRLVDNVQFRFGQALKPVSQGLHKLVDRLKKKYLLDFKGFDPDRLTAATIVMEGSRDEVSFQERHILALARQFGGLSGGEGNGRRGYMLTYAIAYIRDFLADYYILGETFETSVPWDRIPEVCRAVREKAEAEHEKRGLPGRCYVSYRVTQVYHTGVCIYFMYGFYARGVEEPEEVFGEIEHALRQTIIEQGGSISHHHGVGKIRKDFMGDTLSDSGIGLIRGVKQATDPTNVFAVGNNVFSE